MVHMLSYVEPHMEEAAFHWLLRDNAACAPHYLLGDLARLDCRIDAYIDGLRIAGAAGWDVCKEALRRQEVGEVFAASVLAFGDGDEVRTGIVLGAGSASRQLSRGLVSALGWLPYIQAKGHINAFLTNAVPVVRRIGVAACAVHRRDPGSALIEALGDCDLVLRARSLRAVGELGRTDLLGRVLESLRAEDVGWRFPAAWSAALLGDTAGAVDVLRSLARVEGPQGEEATRIVCRRMDVTAANEWQRELSRMPGCERLAIIAAGAIGDPAAIPWLVDQMTIPPQARVAGEAFTMITGVDIAYEDLEGEWPEGFEAGPTENPEDENVEMDPDENLPWPSPGLIEAWWAKNRGRFRNGTRYLVGQPIADEHLQQVLRTGYQRQRAAAALELAMLHPGQPLFEVRAPGFRQQQILGLTRTGR
jgi:uncharacterized protein (TIGR02270 family)